MIQVRSQRPTGFLQCFDTAGLVIWSVKIVPVFPEMTYDVLSETLNLYTTQYNFVRIKLVASKLCNVCRQLLHGLKLSHFS